MIQLHQVAKRFGTHEVLRNLSLQIQSGELFVLVGASGCGKTTLLRLINRLVEPTSGTVHVNGHDIAQQPAHLHRRTIGYCAQSGGLFPHLGVGRNVAVTLELLGWSSSDIQERVHALLELVHLPPDEFAARNMDELSGGQKQRVAVARALAAKPLCLLFDEPFGALDPVTRESLQQELRTIVQSTKTTTVFVTHDMTEALLLGDRIGVMHQGELLQIGSPKELTQRPAHNQVRALLESPTRQVRQLKDLLA